MADEQITNEQANADIEAAIRAKEAKVAEGRAVLAEFAELFEEEPEEAEAIRGRIRELEAAIELDRLMIRLGDIANMTTREQYELGDKLLDAALECREYAGKAYNWGENVKLISRLLLSTGKVLRQEERQRRREAERAARELANNAIADFIFDEADLRDAKGFYIPPGASDH